MKLALSALGLLGVLLLLYWLIDWDKYGRFKEAVRIVNGTASCSGVALDSATVLTARHCVEKVHNASKFFPVRGRHIQSTDAFVAKLHGTLDLAVLCLRKTVDIDSVGWSHLDVVKKGVAVTYAGYSRGNLAFGETTVTHADGESFTVDDSPPCSGDSGGPAYVSNGGHDFLVGIVDEHVNEGDTCGKPIRFVRLDHQDVRDWIATAGDKCKTPAP